MFILKRFFKRLMARPKYRFGDELTSDSGEIFVVIGSRYSYGKFWYNIDGEDYSEKDIDSLLDDEYEGKEPY